MPSPAPVFRSSIRRSSFALAALAMVFTAATLGVRSPAPAVAAGAVAAGSTAPTSLVAPLTPLAVRGGRGFGGRRFNPNRPTTRSRPAARRNPNTGRALRSFSRSMLRVLGIAFLLSLLFGIGPGGSPLGLLVLLGIIALVVVARRRRRQQAHYGYR